MTTIINLDSITNDKRKREYDLGNEAIFIPRLSPMNTIQNLIKKLNYSSKGFITPIILLPFLNFFPFPLAHINPSSSPLNNLEKITQPIAEAMVLSGNAYDFASSSLVHIFFGNESTSGKALETVQRQIAFVSSRPAYQASLAVVEKNAEAIQTTAASLGVPGDVALGVAFLENGGSEQAVSSAGAAGVFQLMPGTARNLGLTVNKKKDERMNPEKNIQAGISYLASNYQKFGDWGLATWAYHAGEGNVAHALRIYADKHDGISFAPYDYSAMNQYVQSHQITIDKLLGDPDVQQFTQRLDDDSAGYPYKVIATSVLFHQGS